MTDRELETTESVETMQIKMSIFHADCLNTLYKNVHLMNKKTTMLHVHLITELVPICITHTTVEAQRIYCVEH